MAAVLPPSPPLQVAAASFFRLECDHPQLFQTEYKRSNRTKGLKILRCFPHCCPEHIDRSYCGTSLSIRIQLAPRPPGTAPPNPPPSEVLAVFARFEAVNDVSLRPGECVEVDKMQAGMQSESNLEGQWVPGVLDRPSGLVTTIRTPGAPSDKHKPLVYHLNGKAFSRWYYDWESGANKAQRLMKHVLKAYIVERCAVDMDDNFTTITSREAYTQLFRIVDVVVSPEFTVISYRRAPLEQFQAAQAALLATGAPMPPQMFARSGMSPFVRAPGRGPEALRAPEGSYQRATYPLVHNASGMPSIARDRGFPGGTEQLQARGQPDAYGECELAPSQMAKRRRRFPTRPVEAFSARDPVEDKLWWEHGNTSAVAVSKNLALLYSFLRWAPLGVYASFVDELVHLIHHKLLEPLAAASKQTGKLNCFSRVLLEHARAERGASSATGGGVASGVEDGPAALPYELETLLRVVSQTTLWLFSTETRQWLRGFFRQHAGCVLDKKAMRSCFLMFLRELEARLDSQVFAATALHSLANVAEEVIAAVYSYQYFHARRPLVRQILSGQSFAGWTAFVAQMRDTYVGVTSSPGVPRALAKQSELSFKEAHPPHNTIESGWNAEWLLDMEEALWKPSESGTPGDGEADGGLPGVSLFTMFELISQMVRLEVAMDVRERTLSIRSTQGMAGRSDCMRVVLDGKDRVFRLFPNGLTSNSGGGACGDYVGDMRVEEPGRLVVYLQIFNWAVEGGGPSYNVRTRIECWRNRRLSINGDVLATTAPASFTAEETPYLGEMALRGKRKAVEKAHARQFRAVGTSDSKSRLPWKEHGRFRLSYHKI
ncbi:hypothetical protein BBJ28_00025291 [Nothophytophthora sp. Chile5]|nr:hypothetical protein BBJ28_00025291 [Nothophytophthora sp. Chile5]